MSNFNITNLQKVLPPSWKRRKKIIFNPIFQDNDDLEEMLSSKNKEKKSKKLGG